MDPISFILLGCGYSYPTQDLGKPANYLYWPEFVIRGNPTPVVSHRVASYSFYHERRYRCSVSQYVISYRCRTNVYHREPPVTNVFRDAYCKLLGIDQTRKRVWHFKDQLTGINSHSSCFLQSLWARNFGSDPARCLLPTRGHLYIPPRRRQSICSACPASHAPSSWRSPLRRQDVSLGESHARAAGARQRHDGEN